MSIFLTLFLAQADSLSPLRCESRLVPPRFSISSEEKLRSLLNRRETLPKVAISSILKHLALDERHSGIEKHKRWMDWVSVYNRGRSTYWITSPCLKTQTADVVCWGEVRGHLVVFESSGRVFKSFNPLRPNPQTGPNGFYTVDWDDPTLKEVTE